MKERITDKKWFVYALVPLCALCWGFSYLGITVTLKSLEPIQLLAMRWTVSALIFSGMQGHKDSIQGKGHQTGLDCWYFTALYLFHFRDCRRQTDYDLRIVHLYCDDSFDGSDYRICNIA